MRNDQEVIEHLLARAVGKKDKRKIGLIIQGGGMRGAFSSGAAQGLDDVGLTDCFDYIYASSSGSCAAAYLLSGQIQKAGSIYWNHLYGLGFIRPWRLSKIMDLDYLCDDLFRNQYRLNRKRLRDSKTLLKVYLTESETGRSEFITNRDKDDMVSAIKASCSLPSYYPKPVSLRGRVYYDGNVGKALPFEEALRDGCTDLLVIATISENAKDSPFLNYFLSFGFKSKLREMVKTRTLNYQENVEMIFGRKRKLQGLDIYTISPHKSISKAEVRRWVLEKTGMKGRESVLRAFGRIK